MAAWLGRSSEEAPIEDGTFLLYDIDGSMMRLTFSPADEDEFSTSFEYADEHGKFGTETHDYRLHRATSSILACDLDS